MATYFDWTEDEHLSLLPRGMRDFEDLESVSARAEAQVLMHYTVSTIAPQGMFGTFKYVSTFTNTPEGATTIGNDQAVCLRGYAVDADDCTNAALKIALRRAIADQMRWLRARDEREAGVSGESKGKASSKQYGVSDAEKVKICQEAHDWLRLFDVTPPVFNI
jgi:hypothetical protein